MKKITIILMIFLTFISAKEPKHITFLSSDGVRISANLYMEYNDTKKPFIVLFHRAGWSRGEYEEIAPKLNKLGFNCMAIDQRSGDEVNLVENETKKDAIKKGKPTTYLDAINDIKSALKYAREHFAKGKLVAWGSSYSASLVIVVVANDNSLADAVISFSPGEYFSRFGKSKDWVAKEASKLKVPIFITSAKNEKSRWINIYNAIKSPKVYYLPPKGGVHGSETLWEEYEESKGYWKAVEKFLKKYVLN